MKVVGKMSKGKRFIKDIIEPIDYHMSKLPTFNKQSEGTITKISTSNTNPDTKTIETFSLWDNNQRKPDSTIVVSG